MLVVSGDQPLPVERLVDALWPNRPPRTATNLVHGYVARLRRAMDDPDGELLRTGATGYQLQLGPDDLDANHFERLAEQGRQALRTGDPAGAAKLLTEALGLWRGTPFADVPPLDAVTAEATRLIEVHDTTVESRIEADLAVGRHAELVAELQARVDANPFREGLWGQLMRALYGCGRQADALAAYQRLYDTLDTELGVQPGPALHDLQERILRNDPALAPPAASGATPAAGPAVELTTDLAPAAVPRQLPMVSRHFVGRDAECKQLDELATGGRDVTPIALLTGPPGIGKTATAVYWARRNAELFPDGQLYADLRGFDPTGAPLPSTEVIRAFLRALGVPVERVPADADAAAAMYRSLLAQRRMLVLLDDARDAEQVRPLLPAGPGCLVLVTSRDRLTGLVVDNGAQPVPLDLLPDPDAHDLLVRHLGAGRVAAEEEAAHAVVDCCAHLPLALTVAAARAAVEPGLPLATLAAELSCTKARLDVLDTGEDSTTVRAVFARSYEAVSEPAQRLFRLFGLDPGPDVTLAAAASLLGVPPRRTRLLLAELVRIHLVAEATPGRFACHDLLRAYATELVHTEEPAAERCAALRRLFDHYLHTAATADRLLYPHRPSVGLPVPNAEITLPDLPDHATALAWFDTEHATLIAVTEWAGASGFDAHAWRLATALGEYLGRRGRWNDLITVQQIAVEAARRLEDGAGQAHAHRGLARAHAFRGEYDLARKHFGRALEQYAAIGDDIHRARTHLGLAVVGERVADYDDALAHSQRAESLYRAAGDEVGRARALNMVGWYHSLRGEPEPALAYCREALALQEAAGDELAQAETLDSLGHALHQLGELAGAIDCYQRSVTLTGKAGDRRGAAYTLTQLGDVHHANGDTAAARDCWREALAILNELEHVDADGVRARLAGTHPRTR